MPNCDSMPVQSDPAANLCEAHCLVGQQVQSDNSLSAPIGVLLPLVVRPVPALLGGRSTFVKAETPLPTPPPLLRFTRLLI